MKKKILVITSSFPRYKNDWWAQFIASIYKNIDKSIFDITIVAPHAPGAKLIEDIEGIKVVRFPYFYPFSLERLTSGSGILHSSEESIFAKLQILFFVAMQFIYSCALLIKNRYHLVHIHWIIPQGIEGLLIKFFFNTPVIATVHGSDLFGLKQFNFFKKIILKNATICTVNSSATLKEVKNIEPRTKIELIPMGVDTKMFSSDKKKVLLKKQYKNATLLLAVGRLIGCKGLDYLIQSLPTVINRFPNIRLLIVGDGPERKNLEYLIKKCNLAQDVVIFLGSVPHAQLSTIYASSDMLIVPSVTDKKTGETEGQGIVVLEGMASGIPVIGSACGGISDLIINGKNGLLVKERDVRGLSNAIIKMILDKKLEDICIKNGQQMVRKEYSWEVVGEKFTHLYSKILHD